MTPDERYAAKLAAMKARYGPTGSVIPGSRFRRAYCPSCAEPMRAPCDDCGNVIVRGSCPSCVAAGHPGHGSPHGSSDPDANGGWGNVTTALDE